MRDAERRAVERGAALYHASRYFEAHEAWEDAWRACPAGPQRTLYQALVQLAAGFHKLTVMKDPTSARRILERALAKLAALADDDAIASSEVLDLDVALLRRALEAILSRADLDLGGAQALPVVVRAR